MMSRLIRWLPRRVLPTSRYTVQLNPADALEEFYRESFPVKAKTVLHAREEPAKRVEHLSRFETALHEQSKLKADKPFHPPTPISIESILLEIRKDSAASNIATYTVNNDRHELLVDTQVVLQLETQRERISLAEALIKKVSRPSQCHPHDAFLVPKSFGKERRI